MTTANIEKPTSDVQNPVRNDNASTREAAPALEVHDLTVAYERKPVLWDVDFSIPSGNLVAMIGPNGAGKSTILKAVLGLLVPASGWVKVLGEPVASQRKLIGYVPQGWRKRQRLALSRTH